MTLRVSSVKVASTYFITPSTTVVKGNISFISGINPGFSDISHYNPTSFFSLHFLSFSTTQSINLTSHKSTYILNENFNQSSIVILPSLVVKKALINDGKFFNC